MAKVKYKLGSCKCVGIDWAVKRIIELATKPEDIQEAIWTLKGAYKSSLNYNKNK